MHLQSIHEIICQCFDLFWWLFVIGGNVLLVSIDGVKSQHLPVLVLKLLNAFLSTGQSCKVHLNHEALGIVGDVLVDLC